MTENQTPFNTLGGNFGTPTDPQAQQVAGFAAPAGVGGQVTPQGFAGVGGQAGAAPQGFPAPQPQPQFVPQAAPQVGYAPQQGYAPAPQYGQANAYAPQVGYAPQAAPQIPTPEPIYVHADALVPNGQNNAVGQSSGAGDKRPLREDLGKPCFFRLKKIFTRPNPNQNGALQEVAVADRIVIDTANPANSGIYRDVWVFNGPVVSDFKESIAAGLAFHEGRPVEKPTQRGGKPAIVLQPLTEEEHSLALQLGAAAQWLTLEA